MKKLLFGLALLLALPTQAAQAPNIDFNVPTLPGQLSDLKGEVVYLDFFASWCAPCRRSFPWLNDMQAKYQSQGLRVVAVNVDKNPAEAAQFIQDFPPTFSVIYSPDGSIAKTYQLLGMPSSYLIDRKGELRSVHQGFFNKKIADYEAEIQALLAEKE